jgi:hypothetical protein
MKTNQENNAVQIMRTLRDRMSEEMRGMTPKQQIAYIEEKSGLKLDEHKEPSVDTSTGL